MIPILNFCPSLYLNIDLAKIQKYIITIDSTQLLKIIKPIVNMVLIESKPLKKNFLPSLKNDVNLSKNIEPSNLEKSNKNNNEIVLKNENQTQEMSSIPNIDEFPEPLGSSIEYNIQPIIKSDEEEFETITLKDFIHKNNLNKGNWIKIF